MLIKTVRKQYWKKAALSYLAIAAIFALAVTSKSDTFVLFAIIPFAYLIWGTGAKCPNCHNKVQQISGFLRIPWCPKSCYTCGKNLSRR